MEEEYALRKTRRGVRAKKKTKLLERAGGERMASPRVANPGGAPLTP